MASVFITFTNALLRPGFGFAPGPDYEFLNEEIPLNATVKTSSVAPSKTTMAIVTFIDADGVVKVGGTATRADSRLIADRVPSVVKIEAGEQLSILDFTV